MEDNHFLDSNQLNIQKERPTFLTVLCIITFIVSGILLTLHLLDAISFDQLEQEEQIEEQIITIVNMFPDIGQEAIEIMKQQLEERLNNHSSIAWMSIIGLLLSLLGAYMMFNMKKIGFHLYTAAKLIGLSTILFFTMNSIVIMDYTLTALYSIAFVVMYAVNLKHMKAE